jgi:hypothetical protein
VSVIEAQKEFWNHTTHHSYLAKMEHPSAKFMVILIFVALLVTASLNIVGRLANGYGPPEVVVGRVSKLDWEEMEISPLQRQRAANDLVHTNVTVDTRDHEDHTFAGIMFDVRARGSMPIEYIEIQAISGLLQQSHCSPSFYSISPLFHVFDTTNTHHILCVCFFLFNVLIVCPAQFVENSDQSQSGQPRRLSAKNTNPETNGLLFSTKFSPKASMS